MFWLRMVKFRAIATPFCRSQFTMNRSQLAVDMNSCSCRWRIILTSIKIGVNPLSAKGQSRQHNILHISVYLNVFIFILIVIIPSDSELSKSIVMSLRKVDWFVSDTDAVGKFCRTLNGRVITASCILSSTSRISPEMLCSEWEQDHTYKQKG